MGPAWLFLLVANGVELALPNAAVYRLLHREDPEFQRHLAEALDLAAFLGADEDSSLPGVVRSWRPVRLGSWGCTNAGTSERVSYLTLRPELFAASRPWCRGSWWVVTVGPSWWRSQPLLEPGFLVFSSGGQLLALRLNRFRRS